MDCSPIANSFRRKRSCETQLVNFNQELVKGLSEGQQYDVNIMDFSNAFDCVPNQRLLRKAEYFGIDGAINSWLEFFLSNRSPRVLVDDETFS